MEKSRHYHYPTLALIAAILIAGIASLTFAASPPVTVTMTVGGDPVPGATVTAKAKVGINDGSTLQGITWTQTGGIKAILGGNTSDTIAVALPSRTLFREELMTVLEEAPITDAQRPANMPASLAYEGGLQNRFVVAGASPHAIADAAAIKFDVAVTTSSGTYHTPVTLASNLPWEMATGTRNVPILLPVLLHAKTQATYNWSLTAPPASAATLLDPTTQTPEFTPDVAGTYQLAVTDIAANKPVTITVHAGTWKGIITGQDAAGRPIVDTACTGCHVKNTPHFDLFTPWAQSGHAEIFTQNITTPGGHYTSACVSCHTVGFNAKAVKNNGIDEAADWADFVKTDLLTHGDPQNWTKTLANYPATAKMANIQCENCHGPQDSAAHMKKDGSRKTLSSELCGTCHGEPMRHGRYQQWQLSGHANYEVAIAEGTDATCAKCHSAQGFVQWKDKGFSTAALDVTWTTDEVHPQTCVTCHDPHDVGTTSGGPATNSKVRVTGKTPLLMAGFTATNVGSGAICMTCHNGRRDLRDDAHFTVADATRAPHEGPQADILMGQNLYLTKVGTPGFHSMVEDSCVNCHMEKTTAPASISLPGVGTNHTFYADRTICSKCHSNITADSVQGPVTVKMDTLKGEIQNAIKNAMVAQIRLGNAIDLNGVKTIKSASDIAGVEFISSHGRQGVNVNLKDGGKVSDLSLQSVKVVRPAGSAVELYAVIDPNVAKAGWNYMMVS